MTLKIIKYAIPQILLCMILVHVVMYVHVATTEIHDIGQEKIHVVHYYLLVSEYRSKSNNIMLMSIQYIHMLCYTITFQT